MIDIRSITFGWETEVAAGAADVLSNLAAEGLATGEMHHYHCKCADCDHRSRWLFRGQEDCTADGEIISSVLSFGNPDYERAVTGLARALVKARAVPSMGVGNHVHVGRQDMTPADNVRLVRLFVHYQDELAELANGKFPEVRDYNAPLKVRSITGAAFYWHESGLTEEEFWHGDPDEVWGSTPATAFSDRLSVSGWLADKDHTWEFRLWNATRAEWRIRGYVALSVAMVAAAMDGVNVTPNERRPLHEVLAPYLHPDGWAFLLAQRYTHGGIAA